LDDTYVFSDLEALTNLEASHLDLKRLVLISIESDDAIVHAGDVANAAFELPFDDFDPFTGGYLQLRIISDSL